MYVCRKKMNILIVEIEREISNFCVISKRLVLNNESVGGGGGEKWYEIDDIDETLMKVL